MTDSNALPPVLSPPSTCGDDYPPSRPGVRTLVVAAVVVVLGAGLVFWPAISAAIH